MKQNGTHMTVRHTLSFHFTTWHYTIKYNFTSLIFNFLTLFLKICGLQGKVPAPLQVDGSRVLWSYFVQFHEIQHGGHATEGEVDAVIFNLVASTVPKWKTFKLLRWTQNLYQSAREHYWSFCNHGNHTPFSCDRWYLCNNGSYSWTQRLTTVTTVGNTTRESKVCSSQWLNNATDTVLLDNARKVGELVLSWTYSFTSRSVKLGYRAGRSVSLQSSTFFIFTTTSAVKWRGSAAVASTQVEEKIYSQQTRRTAAIKRI
jgi:hypothetical protein